MEVHFYSFFPITCTYVNTERAIQHGALHLKSIKIGKQHELDYVFPVPFFGYYAAQCKSSKEHIIVSFLSLPAKKGMEIQTRLVVSAEAVKQPISPILPFPRKA